MKNDTIHSLDLFLFARIGSQYSPSFALYINIYVYKKESPRQERKKNPHKDVH